MCDKMHCKVIINKLMGTVVIRSKWLHCELDRSKWCRPPGPDRFSLSLLTSDGFKLLVFIAIGGLDKVRTIV